MKAAIESDVIVADPPCQSYSAPRCLRRFSVPNFVSWSINQVEHIEVTGQRRHDCEREARISQLGVLLESPVATPLWRRVCKHAMYGEIRARSADQRLVMELAIQESMR